MAGENDKIADSVKTMLDAFRGDMTSALDSAKKSFMDSVAECNKRMDAFEEEKKADAKAKADAEEEEKKKADAKAKADAEEEEKKKADAAKADAARVDALVKDHPDFKSALEQLNDLRAQVSRLPAQHVGDDKAKFADAQATYDPAYLALGTPAPQAMMGELIGDYRRRLARGLQQHCAPFKDADLSKMADDAAFMPIEKMIISDAMKAAHNPVVPEGKLIRVKRADQGTGREVIEYHGKPMAWMQDFMAANKATSTRAIRAVDPRQMH